MKSLLKAPAAALISARDYNARDLWKIFELPGMRLRHAKLSRLAPGGVA